MATVLIRIVLVILVVSVADFDAAILIVMVVLERVDGSDLMRESVSVPSCCGTSYNGNSQKPKQRSCEEPDRSHGLRLPVSSTLRNPERAAVTRSWYSEAVY